LGWETTAAGVVPASCPWQAAINSRTRRSGRLDIFNMWMGPSGHLKKVAIGYAIVTLKPSPWNQTVFSSARTVSESILKYSSGIGWSSYTHIVNRVL
jgi:hypothetical protein